MASKRKMTGPWEADHDIDAGWAVWSVDNIRQSAIVALARIANRLTREHKKRGGPRG